MNPLINYSNKPLPRDFINIRRKTILSTLESIWNEDGIPQIVVVKDSAVTGIPDGFWQGDFIILKIGLKQISNYTECDEGLSFSVGFAGKRHTLFIPYTHIAVIENWTTLFSMQLPVHLFDHKAYDQTIEEQVRFQENLVEMAATAELDISEPIDPEQKELQKQAKANGGKPKLGLV